MSKRSASCTAIVRIRQASGHHKGAKENKAWWVDKLQKQGSGSQSRGEMEVRQARRMRSEAVHAEQNLKIVVLKPSYVLSRLNRGRLFQLSVRISKDCIISNAWSGICVELKLIQNSGFKSREECMDVSI